MEKYILKKYTLKEMVNYQIFSSRFAGFVSWPWLQRKIAKYYIWKCKKRHGRYNRTIKRRKMVEEHMKEQGK